MKFWSFFIFSLINPAVTAQVNHADEPLVNQYTEKPEAHCSGKLQIYHTEKPDINLSAKSQINIQTGKLSDNQNLQKYIDSLAEVYLKNPANSSLSIGIVKGTQTTTYFYGVTKKGNDHLPDGYSLYDIASLSKTFTALLLAHAVNQGKIRLNDDIRKYLPGNYPGLQFKGVPVTVANLSNHTSGLPAFPADQQKTATYDPLNPFLNYSKDSVYQYLSAFQPDTLPGTKSIYSNLGFAVLGIVLENVYKLPLETLLQQLITQPLKMKGTFFTTPVLQINRLTTGYNGATGEEVPHWEFGAFKAAGGLKSDLNDLLIYLKANMNTLNADYALTHQETNQQQGFKRGLAWIIEPLDNYELISHNGGTNGYRSYCGFIKEKKAGIVIMSNSSSEIEETALKILSFLTKKDKRR